MPDLSPLSALLLALMLKGTVVLALAWAAARVFGGASAAARHGVWVAAFAALLLLPGLEAVGPSWSVAVLPAAEQPLQPAPTASVSALSVLPEDASFATVTAFGAATAGRLSRFDAEMHPLAPLQPAQPRASVPMVSSAAARELVAETAVASSPSGWRARFGWARLFGWALALWALGAAIVGAGYMGAFASAWRLVGRARVEEDEAWTALVAQAGRRMGLPPSVRLLRSSRLDVPIAWGFGGGAVVVPAAADGWTAERRAAVVLHEMAHLRRRDAWTQVIAQAALALHWFNPFAWAAYRHFLDAREQACDDAVLSSGARASAYAAHLVGVARAVRQVRREPLALSAVAAMARRVPLEARVQSILDESRRRGPLRLRESALTTLLGAAVLLPLAAFQPTARPLPSPQSHAGQAASSVLAAVPSPTPTLSLAEEHDLFWAHVDAARRLAESGPTPRTTPVPPRTPDLLPSDSSVAAAQRLLERAMQQVERVHRRVEAAHLQLGGADTGVAFERARADFDEAQRAWAAVQDTLSAAQRALEQAVWERHEASADEASADEASADKQASSEQALRELESSVRQAIRETDRPQAAPRPSPLPAARPRAARPPIPPPTPTPPRIDWGEIDQARQRAAASLSS